MLVHFSSRLAAFNTSALNIVDHANLSVFICDYNIICSFLSSCEYKIFGTQLYNNLLKCCSTYFNLGSLHRALSRFDALDYEGTHDFLELVPGGSITNLDEESPLPRLMWDPQEVVRTSQIQLLRVLLSLLLGQDQR